MDVFIMILGAICVLIGVAGSLLPILPGTPVSYIGLLLLLAVDGCSFSVQFMLIILALVVLQQILNYVIPIWGVKKYGGSKAGQWGGVLGLLVGLLFMPWGMIVGPFVGAVLGEMMAGKNTSDSLKAGFGSFVGNLLTTVSGLVLSGVMAYYYFAEVFRLVV
ncbi:MAG: DUF456 domain-containing protein [Paludibacteraceae bacterium]|jgi:uncharacterized protein YqgC (DUF456 family)|nr:DUF456 domain-containing protein [Paludibacteraceae bacterium]MED9996557.1 DUF456 domain-containing protein [Paludibacteraceae bacterium]